MWVDPVTVVQVNGTHTKWQSSVADENDDRRHLGKQRKRLFHGTNAFLLPFRNELLGIGHFHRPLGRGPNEYARHGHHYTHAFYTISEGEPYHLKRLSAEFVFPSKQHPTDADIIQFASGLELDEINEKAVIAYGINDCEGGAVYVDLEVLEEMLRPVKKGQEVLDTMRKIDSF